MMELNEQTFDPEVLKARVPVLVDFYAPWCGPCKMLTPVLDALAREFDGRIKFAKVNVDEASALAWRYQISGVPTLMLFRHGELIDTIVGLAPRAALKARLEAVAGLAQVGRDTVVTAA